MVFSDVVVVVTGASCVVCAEVVVVLDGVFASFTVVQAESDARATAEMDRMMNFFIGMIVVSIASAPPMIAYSVVQLLWGVSLLGPE